MTGLSPPLLRSDFNRKRLFGCQTRRKSATQITEKTPAATSVIRKNSCELEMKNWATAKEMPQTVVAGHTSQASLHLPPSIRTKVLTNQKGTTTETKGSWRPAM